VIGTVRLYRIFKNMKGKEQLQWASFIGRKDYKIPFFAIFSQK